MDIRTLVMDVLKEYPTSRDNDLDLLARVWYKQGFKMSKEHFDFFITHCTTPETITRIRRDLQSSGQFKPTEKTRLQRTLKEAEYHDKYKKNEGTLGDWGEIEALFS